VRVCPDTDPQLSQTGRLHPKSAATSSAKKEDGDGGFGTVVALAGLMRAQLILGESV
jgi:hypothetical protein